MACAAQGLPAEGTLSENGPAQFEINLRHRDDALAAADDAIMLKRAIKGAAARQGMMASFMAKPYAAKSGSGMHVHVSVLDDKGRNIFAGKDDKKGSARLRHAVAGVLNAMPASMAVLAPHANSYRRFRAGSHAPTTLTWGYDNRSAALRIPDSAPDATRIEHRVAGADANPYLVLAVILAAVLDGLEDGANPPPPLTGNAYAAKAKTLPRRWEEALDVFAASPFADRAFGHAFKKVFLACKRQEMEIIEAEISSVEHDAYLRDA
jgi:glutamine synthetase